MSEFSWMGVGGFNKDMYMQIYRKVEEKIKKNELSKRDATNKLLKYNNLLYGLTTVYTVVVSEVYFKHFNEIEKIESDKNRINKIIDIAKKILDKLNSDFKIEEIMFSVEKIIIEKYELNVSASLLTSLTYVVKPVIGRKVDLESNITELLINYNINSKYEELIVYLWIIEDLVDVIAGLCTSVQYVIVTLCSGGE